MVAQGRDRARVLRELVGGGQAGGLRVLGVEAVEDYALQRQQPVASVGLPVDVDGRCARELLP